MSSLDIIKAELETQIDASSKSLEELKTVLEDVIKAQSGDGAVIVKSTTKKPPTPKTKKKKSDDKKEEDGFFVSFNEAKETKKPLIPSEIIAAATILNERGGKPIEIYKLAEAIPKTVKTTKMVEEAVVVIVRGGLSVLGIRSDDLQHLEYKLQKSPRGARKINTASIKNEKLEKALGRGDLVGSVYTGSGYKGESIHAESKRVILVGGCIGRTMKLGFSWVANDGAIVANKGNVNGETPGSRFSLFTEMEDGDLYFITSAASGKRKSVSLTSKYAFGSEPSLFVPPKSVVDSDVKDRFHQ